MPRVATGSKYQDGGAWYVSVTVAGKRRHFRLAAGTTEEQAERRKLLVADIAVRLQKAKKADLAEALCRQAAELPENRLEGLRRIVEGLVAGREEVDARPPPPARSDITYRQFGEQWTSGALHLLHPDHVKAVDHTDNRTRLTNYVYPVVGDIPLKDLRLDDLDKIFKQPNLPAGSRRHIALVARRVLSLAVYPGKHINQIPTPRGWLPKPNPEKQKVFLYPAEELSLMQTTSIPLVRRMFIGFLAREGPRKEEAANLEWSDLELDAAEGDGIINLVENKTDDPRSWVLDPGTAEALRRWRKIVGNSRWVFPATMASRPKKPEGHIYVDHLARELREALVEAGVTREALFVRDAKRQQVRAHDLRATFITLSLASGRSEAWAQARTGHTSSVMINRYSRKIRTATEARLGWLHPLHLAVPELAALGDDGRESSDETSGAAEDDFGSDDDRRPNAA